MLLVLTAVFGKSATIRTRTWASDDCSGDTTEDVSSDPVEGGDCSDAVDANPLLDQCINVMTGLGSSMITCEESGGGMSCFDTAAIVDTKFGAMRIGDLKKGDMVKDSSGDFSEVVGFIHRGDEESLMNEIRTTIGIMRVSGNHIVDTTQGMYQAKDLEVGMSLVGSSGPAEIEEIVEYMASGFIAPLTKSGTIQVDGFNASCYASIPAWMHSLANAFFWPRRYIFTDFAATKNGVDTYAAFWEPIGASLGVYA